MASDNNNQPNPSRLFALPNQSQGMKMPDFSNGNPFGGNIAGQALMANNLLGGNNTSPFSMSSGAAAASALPFGGGGFAGGGGGVGGALNAAASKIEASNNRLIAALDKLSNAVGGGMSGGLGSGAFAGGGGRGLNIGGLNNRLLAANARSGDVTGMQGDLFGGFAAPSAGPAGGFSAGQMRAGAMAMAAIPALSGIGSGMGGMFGATAAAARNRGLLNASIAGESTAFQNISIAEQQQRIAGQGQIASSIGGGLMAIGGGMAMTGIGAPIGLGLMAAGALTSIITGGVTSARQGNVRADAKSIAEDRALTSARRAMATAGANTLADVYSAKAQFSDPRGSGLTYARRASKIRMAADIAQNTIIPLEQEVLPFFGNVRFENALDTQYVNDEGQLIMGGRNNKTKSYFSGLIGGDIDTSMTSTTNVLAMGLGYTNVEASRTLVGIVKGQGFRGIFSDIAAGRMDRSKRKAGKISTAFRPTQSSYADYLRTSGRTFGRTLSPSDDMFSYGEDVMADHAVMNAAGDIIGAESYVAAGLSRMAGTNLSSGVGFIGGALQAGFDASTIGAALGLGRRGVGITGTQNNYGESVLRQADFMGLRGGAAQSFISATTNFIGGRAARGFAMQFDTSPMAYGMQSHRGRLGIIQDVSTANGRFTYGQLTGSQIIDQANTFINYGKRAGLDYFYGAEGIAAAGRVQGNVDSLHGRFKGMLGGFGKDVLFASVLQKTGSISQAMKAVEGGMGVGDAGAMILDRLGTGRAGMLGLLSLDDVTTSDAAVMMQMYKGGTLEGAMEKTIKFSEKASQGTASATRAEKETNRARNFDRALFRQIAVQEEILEESKLSTLTLKEILAALKGGSSSKSKPTKTKPESSKTPTPPAPSAPPAPPPGAPPGAPGFSDIRLKKDIKRIGKSPSGYNVYEFRYNNKLTTDNTLWRGVMAQEVMQVNPAAVSIASNGYYCVDYNLLDVDMIKVK
jgi:hypothetical protein